MQEDFEARSILSRERLRELQSRSNGPSAWRLTLHVAAFLGCAALLVVFHDRGVVALPLSLILAGITAAFFAPFHECVHQTAFRGRRANRIGAWICAIPFGMAPSLYRGFHWEHHRHTQDPERDPEIMLDPARFSPWPSDALGWLELWSGYVYFRLKSLPTFTLALRPSSSHEAIAPWFKPEENRGLIWACRGVALPWVGLAVATLAGVPGAGWILLGMLLSHVVLGLWLPAEHTGLPHEGTIFARTRTMRPSAFVRWWLWNMNYHAEHHAWPSIPWHRLPEAHREVAEHVEALGDGYLALHANARRTG